MRAMVIGASGLVGGALFSEFARSHETYGTYYRYPVNGFTCLRIEDARETGSAVSSLRPDVVLQPAALPNVDYCEENPHEAWRINVDGTRNVVEAATGVGAKHVFFSTDYVFDGTAGPYGEDDAPSPINVYGRCKLAAEKLIREATPNHLIIRTTGVYGWERRGKNFIVRLLRTLRSGEELLAPVDQVGSPTYAPNLARVVLELVEVDARGTYNVVGTDVVDRYRLALTAADTFALPAELIKPVTTAELGQGAPRPLVSALRVEKVRQIVKTPLLGMEAGLRAMASAEDTL